MIFESATISNFHEESRDILGTKKQLTKSKIPEMVKDIIFQTELKQQKILSDDKIGSQLVKACQDKLTGEEQNHKVKLDHCKRLGLKLHTLSKKELQLKKDCVFIQKNMLSQKRRAMESEKKNSMKEHLKEGKLARCQSESRLNIALSDCIVQHLDMALSALVESEELLQGKTSKWLYTLASTISEQDVDLKNSVNSPKVLIQKAKVLADLVVDGETEIISRNIAPEIIRKRRAYRDWATTTVQKKRRIND